MSMKHFLFYESIIPENLIKFFKINYAYMKEKSYKNKDADKYWEHVYYIYRQWEGLYNGYIKSVKVREKFELLEFLILSSIADSMDAMYYQATENI